MHFHAFLHQYQRHLHVRDLCLSLLESQVVKNGSDFNDSRDMSLRTEDELKP